MSFLSIFQSSLVGTTSNSQRKCRDGDSASVQNFHGLFETFPYFAESVAVRNPHLIKNKFSCFRSSHPQFILLFSGCKTRHSFFEDKCCRIIFCAFLCCAGHYHSNITGNSMSNKVFCSADDPIISISHRGGTHTSGI